MSAIGPEIHRRPHIGVDVHPRAVRVRMQGDLDAGAAPRLDRVLTETISQVATPSGPVTRMTIDLEAVDVLAAAGMTVLLRARDAAEGLGLVYVVCVNPRGRRALAMAGLDRCLLPQPTSDRTAAGSGPSGSMSTIASSNPASE
ncbi:STAS domain-containing protein [Actinomycetospora chiangmaiensis]|uniref:STAS domain-containing protein n=1 Tax=Actinomycetospora chiangmaiensis TaxID=402650 RepID=UPI00037657BF|nr:STAS domain-containing protein [Actinomycetospora chiangmaiensis]